MVRAVLVLALIAAAALWWARDEASRFVSERVPAAGPYLERYVSTGPARSAAPAAPARPAIPVVTARAERKSLPVTIEAVGTVQSVASIQIKPRIDSQITSIAVREGALVASGDLLVALDARAVSAQLAQADATIEKGRAQLEQVRRDFSRAEDLLAKRINTEVQRDTAGTQVKIAQAQLGADQAQRDAIATQLSYTQIRSPIAGRIGSISLKEGTTVRAADAQAIMTVNQVDPIYVSFAVPQSLFPALRAAQAKGRVGVQSRVGGAVVEGTVAFVENTVDLATGTVLARAEMSNRDERLWPGAFVAVQATLGIEADAIAVPAAAVQIGQQGAFVFVIRDGRRAAIVPVEVARQTPAETVIARGLSGGEEVVVDGQLRLVDGATVQIQPARPGGGVATGRSDTPAPANRS